VILRALVSIAVFFLLQSCAGTRPPASLVELEHLTDGHVSRQVREQSPGAWGEGLRYLSLARDAADAGSEVQADRFARLGMLHIRIALAAHQHATYRDRLEVALQEKHALSMKEERLQSRLAHIEITQVRRDMRKHLASILDASLLTAAATETLTERQPNSGKRTNKAEARRRVGHEMIARTEALERVLQVYVAAGMLDKEKARVVAREIGRAREKLLLPDLVGVQQHLESAVIAANRLLADSWHNQKNSRAECDEMAAAKLVEGGFYVVRDAIGPTVAFVISGPKPTKNWAREVRKLGRMLAKMDTVHLVVIASSGTTVRPKKTLKKSRKRANATAELLARSGIDRGRLHAFGFGGTSPLGSLRAGRERVAVLIVPTVPE
jgi:hypothetical protein